MTMLRLAVIAAILSLTQACAARGAYGADPSELRSLAERGYAEAQVLLGLRYAEGRGVPQDHAEAVKWFRRAAGQGDAGAQFVLGVMYDKGHGVPQDYAQAHLWLSLAAEQGNGDALRNRQGLEKRMTPAQIAEAERLAKE